MGIGARVTMGYLVLIVVIVLVMLYQSSLVGEMQAVNEHLSKVKYPAGLVSVQLKNDLSDIDEFWSKFLAVGDRTGYATVLKDKLRDFRVKIEGLEGLGLDGLELQAVKRLGEVSDQFERLLSDNLENPDKTVTPQVLDEVARRFGQLGNQTDVLVSTSHQGIKDEVAKSEESFERVRLASWLALGLALALGFTIAFLIARSIAAPVRQLTRATRGLAAGDFSYQVDDSGKDEVAELARHFNAMVRRLNELDQLKGDFVSHVSHELKAPLASMQETTTLLLEEIPGNVNPKQIRLLELNLQCGRRLSAMINNLLDLSRLESGVMEYDLQANDLAALVEEAVEGMEPLAAERECQLGLEVQAPGLIATCDGGRVLQVLRNLIDNALKFSPAGSQVGVQLRSHPTIPDGVPAATLERIRPSPQGYAEIAILDQGSGVADEHKERIFDKFHQVKRGRKVSGQGVGLGLAISRTIIEGHGGALWVEDNHPQGSVFKLLLALG